MKTIFYWMAINSNLDYELKTLRKKELQNFDDDSVIDMINIIKKEIEEEIQAGSIIPADRYNQILKAIAKIKKIKSLLTMKAFW